MIKFISYVFFICGVYHGATFLASQNPFVFYPENKENLDTLLTEPQFLDTCKGLAFGYLSYSHFPSKVLRMKNLEYLDISHSKFPEIPETISKLKELKVFNASYSNLKKVPKQIFLCKKLEELLLLRSNVSFLPSEVEFASNLRILNVSYTKICDFPKTIEKCLKLEEISFIGKRGEFCGREELKNFLVKKFPKAVIWFGEFPE